MREKCVINFSLISNISKKMSNFHLTTEPRCFQDAYDLLIREDPLRLSILEKRETLEKKKDQGNWACMKTPRHSYNGSVKLEI